MFFAHPTVLILLIIPLSLAFFEWARRGQPIVIPVDGQSSKRGYLPMILIQTANMLPTGIMAIAVVLLARPMEHTPPEVERIVTNVQFVLDISPSMSEPYGLQPDDGSRIRRFDAAMDAVDKFTTYRQGDSFGLTIYARFFLHWVPLTANTSAIRYSRTFIQPWDYGKAKRGEYQTGLLYNDLGHTWTLSALKGARKVLADPERASGERMIILITDGINDKNDRVHVPKLIQSMKEEDVTCFCVFINDGNSPEDIKNICIESGGGFFAVDETLDDGGMDAVFKRIDEMKKSKTLEKDAGSVDKAGPFLLPAVICLILHILALFGLRYTPW